MNKRSQEIMADKRQSEKKSGDGEEERPAGHTSRLHEIHRDHKHKITIRDGPRTAIQKKLADGTKKGVGNKEGEVEKKWSVVTAHVEMLQVHAEICAGLMKEWWATVGRMEQFPREWEKVIACSI